jgi:hypothetical protein
MGYPVKKALTDRLLAAMAEPPRLLFGTLQYSARCGARTRSGGRCQNAPMQLGGRCRMHGGAALRGPAHPRYKHGKYSKYRPVDIDEVIAQCAAMGPVDLSELLAQSDPFANLVLDFDLSTPFE